MAKPLSSLIAVLAVLTSTGASQSPGLKLADIDTNRDGTISETELAQASQKMARSRKAGRGGVRRNEAAAGRAAASDPAGIPAPNAGAYTYDVTKEGKYGERAPLASVLTDGLVDVQDLGDKWRVTVPEVIRDTPTFQALNASQQAIVSRVKSDAVKEAQPAPSRSLWDRAITTIEDNFSIGENADAISENFDERDPARIAWTKSKGEKSFYTVDAAIDFHPKFLSNWDDSEAMVGNGKAMADHGGDWDWDSRMRFFFEAHVSTQVGANQNTLQYAIPFEFRLQAPNAEADERNAIAGKDTTSYLVTSHNFAVRPTYVTDRAASIRTWGVDFRYEPTVPALGINLGAPRVLRGGSKNLVWQIQAGIGFSFRSIEEGAKSLPEGTIRADSDNYGVFVADISAEATIFEVLTLRATYGATLDVFGDVQSHDLFQADLVLQLDERQHFSVGITYEKGEVEPTFAAVDTLTAWVGVKF